MALTIERPVAGPDDRLLKRAQRLAAAAQAVEALDLKSIADTYQREAGGSCIEAATVATAALNAALTVSLTGGTTAKEAVEREVRACAKKKAREVRGEEWRRARAEEEGPAGDAAREEARVAHEARVAKAVSGRDERIMEDVATRRALREERACMAASRRALSEARARIGNGNGRKLPMTSDIGDTYMSCSPTVDDPLLRRAKSLCSGAALIVDQLEEQNRALAQKAEKLAPTPSRPPVPKMQPPSPSFAKALTKGLSNAEEDALVARARELLADYKPKAGRGALGSRTPMTHGFSSTPRREPLSPSSRVDSGRQGACTVAVEETRRGTRTRF